MVNFMVHFDVLNLHFSLLTHKELETLTSVLEPNSNFVTNMKFDATYLNQALTVVGKRPQPMKSSDCFIFISRIFHVKHGHQGFESGFGHDCSCPKIFDKIWLLMN